MVSHKSKTAKCLHFMVSHKSKTAKCFQVMVSHESKATKCFQVMVSRFINGKYCYLGVYKSRKIASEVHFFEKRFGHNIYNMYICTTKTQEEGSDSFTSPFFFI